MFYPQPLPAFLTSLLSPNPCTAAFIEFMDVRDAEDAVKKMDGFKGWVSHLQLPLHVLQPSIFGLRPWMFSQGLEASGFCHTPSECECRCAGIYLITATHHKVTRYLVIMFPNFGCFECSQKGHASHCCVDFRFNNCKKSC